MSDIGKRWFGDDYTVERREFTDGDDRVLVKHAVGPAPDEYVEIIIWTTQRMVWVDTYEGRRIHRSVYHMDLQERVV